jgi:rRNA processing protein Gar1
MEYLKYSDDEGSNESDIDVVDADEYEIDAYDGVDYTNEATVAMVVRQPANAVNDIEFIAGLVNTQSVPGPEESEVQVMEKSRGCSPAVDATSRVELGRVAADDMSSDSDSDSEEDYAVNKQATNDPLYWLTEDEDEPNSNVNEPPRTKNEFQELAVVDPGLESVLNPKTEDFTLIGSVLSHLPGQGIIVVQAHNTTTPLAESSVVCLDNGTVVGRVHEVFGPITTPYYVIRLPVDHSSIAKSPSESQGHRKGGRKQKQAKDNKDGMVVCPDDQVDIPGGPEDANTTQVQSVEVGDTDMSTNGPSEPDKVGLLSSDSEVKVNQISDFKNIKVGDQVFTPSRLAEFITPASMQAFRIKGSDASNIFDEEVIKLLFKLLGNVFNRANFQVNADEEEFSDDEAEVI